MRRFAKRLTMLTPLAYIRARLVSALRKRRVGLMFLGLCLLAAACILIWPASRGGQAAGTLHDVSVTGAMLPTATRSAVGMAESASPPTPTLPPLWTPTPLPVPDTGLVWSRNAAGAYLWESPEGGILALLPNGAVVTILEARSSYGNLPWIKVRSPAGEGWIIQTHVFRKGERPVAYVAVAGGTYLRDCARGGVQQALPLGTPIMGILDAQENGSHTWVQVEVLDGTVGWVVEEWLSTEMPASGGG
jgi:hypothetical protein